MQHKQTALTHRLADGRQLGYAQYGRGNGRPFFYFHGLPGARYECSMLHDSANALNVCIYAVDRPGYGLSDRLENRSLCDWPGDVEALADALGIAEFGILGVSGGGPYALACARVLEERISAAGIVCGLGPVYEPDLHSAMRWLARSGFYLAGHAPAVLRTVYGQPLSWLAHTYPALAFRLLAYAGGGADRPVLLRSDILAILSANLREAFRQGPFAAVQDVILYRQPWDFELADIGMHIHLWHGDADPVVPCCHSEFVHSGLTDSTLDILPGEGHFSLPVLYARPILDTLLRHSR